MSSEKMKEVEAILYQRGLKLLEDNSRKIIEKIKTTIIDLVHNPDVRLSLKLSAYLVKELGKDYNYLSRLFSSVENMTIERYLISQKIERAKELLVYDEITLSEIANHLDYSSVQHLSSQFRKITGMSPPHFRKTFIISENTTGLSSQLLNYSTLESIFF
ncbi:MAG: AraC family transcriptional regulator [Cyclobacteriaceae bacterium]